MSVLQVPAQPMQPSSRGNPRAPSPGPLRPFTPPDLSSIPHMDDSPTLNQSTNNQNTADNNNEDDTNGPYIVGSPIDLGNIDNVDNISLRVGPFRRGRRRTREHIELRETTTPENENPGLYFIFYQGQIINSIEAILHKID
ncbi:hypothetical protein PV326_004828 [Microctonus aethiopoides]|nr:hypothetical protein PV326_004828 [Microctonus aethiopoides]